MKMENKRKVIKPVLKTFRFKYRKTIIYVSYDEFHNEFRCFSHFATIRTPKRLEFVNGSLFKEIVDKAIEILKEDSVLKNARIIKRFKKRIYKHFTKSGMGI